MTTRRSGLPDRSEGTCGRRSRRTVWSEQSAASEIGGGAITHMKRHGCLLLHRQKFCRKKKEIEVKFSKAACRPYQPSDKQSQSIVQVELRTLPASRSRYLQEKQVTIRLKQLSISACSDGRTTQLACSDNYRTWSCCSCSHAVMAPRLCMCNWHVSCSNLNQNNQENSFWLDMLIWPIEQLLTRDLEMTLKIEHHQE